jgi:hypothetical protein
MGLVEVRDDDPAATFIEDGRNVPAELIQIREAVIDDFPESDDRGEPEGGMGLVDDVPPPGLKTVDLGR